MSYNERSTVSVGKSDVGFKGHNTRYLSYFVNTSVNSSYDLMVETHSLTRPPTFVPFTKNFEGPCHFFFQERHRNHYDPLSRLEHGYERRFVVGLREDVEETGRG